MMTQNKMKPRRAPRTQRKRFSASLAAAAAPLLSWWDDAPKQAEPETTARSAAQAFLCELGGLGGSFLLVPGREDRIDPARAVRGDQAGGGRGNREQDHRHRRGERIAGRDAL